MSYTMLKNNLRNRKCAETSLEGAALAFVRESCEELRFDKSKATDINADNLDYSGTSLKPEQIPYNMEKDIDRLCLENALVRFLESGKKEDAFDIYFCYLEMFVGDYEKTRRMIEFLSEYEENGSGLLMKHRDHYSHSVYVFCLGLAVYQTNSVYRKKYQEFYGVNDEHEAACHFLRYWGLTSLFHDIGYPFELPFEQVCSYFEVDGNDRGQRPFVAYFGLESFVKLDKAMQRKLAEIYGLGTDKILASTDELFAYQLFEKLSRVYYFSEKEMLDYLREKPTRPNKFGHFMDHAYFSATVLFKKLFCEMQCELTKADIDALTAILLHNSLYKFSVAFYREKRSNIPFKANLHPLAYMLMLCDELQCWDRTAYGRNSKLELHPLGCEFNFSNDGIKAKYLFDKNDEGKIEEFQEKYARWEEKKQGKAPSLKAYSNMYIKDKDGICSFLADIQSIVDLKEISLEVTYDMAARKDMKGAGKRYLSDSNFINLYNFAVVLNGRWNTVEDWKKAKEEGREFAFLSDRSLIKRFNEDFKKLSLEYKLYNINQAKAFAGYMSAIGCFYTDKAVDIEMLESFLEKELNTIGPMEHRRWLQEHYDMGWKYGQPVKELREFQRLHSDMIPHDDDLVEVSEKAAEDNYERLDKATQDKDTDPMDCMLAMLKAYNGIKIYRL